MRQLRRFAPFIADALADGAWMAAWPRVAIVVPALALVVGLLAPRYWPGITFASWWSGSYLYSVSFMVAATAVAILSGAAGVMLFIGYVVGSLFLSNSPFNDYPMNYIAYDPLWGQAALVLPRHVGRLLITYAVFAILIIRVPQIARSLSDDVLRRLPSGLPARPLGRAALYALALGLLTYLWSQAAVPLNRPLTAFLGNGSMGAELVAPLHGGWRWLVGVAMLAGFVRVVAEDWSSRRAPQRRGSAMRPAGNWWAGLPRTTRTALTSVATVFLLSGIMESPLDALVALVGVAAIQLLLSDSGRLLPHQFVRFITQAPLALRFVLGVGVGLWLVNAILPLIAATDGGYRPVLISALLIMALFAVLFPRTKGLTA
jgi:hypothetical protein